MTTPRNGVFHFWGRSWMAFCFLCLATLSRQTPYLVCSISDPLGSFRELFFGLLNVAAGGVEILMTKYLGQSDDIARIVLKVLMRHRMTK